MALFSWQKKAKADGDGDEFTLPDELNKKIEDGAKAAAELPKITEMLSGLKSIMETDAATRAKEKKDRDDAAASVARSKNKETEDAELEELFITDPKKAAEIVARKATESTNVALLTLRADNIKREVFEDADKFKYYTGDIKRKVDAMISQQTLASRNDSSVVENCYKVVLADHMSDILEGKIKSRFAGGESAGRGTSSGNAGAGGAGGKEPPVITEDIKKLAGKFGIKPEDYAEMLDKEGIGYV